jgi:hypothetical protein
MFSFLRSLDLRPLEWSELVDKTGNASPYIGEVLQVGFENAQAVVVVMTPDDEAQLIDRFCKDNEPDHERILTPQARPNVIFETGMAMGLHGSRTIIVQIGRLRTFSDIEGRHFVRVDSRSNYRAAIARRLKAAQCDLNDTGDDWMTSGDFDTAIKEASAASSRLERVTTFAGISATPTAIPAKSSRGIWQRYLFPAFIVGILIGMCISFITSKIVSSWMQAEPAGTETNSIFKSPSDIGTPVADEHSTVSRTEGTSSKPIPAQTTNEHPESNDKSPITIDESLRKQIVQAVESNRLKGTLAHGDQFDRETLVVEQIHTTTKNIQQEDHELTVSLSILGIGGRAPTFEESPSKSLEEETPVAANATLRFYVAPGVLQYKDCTLNNFEIGDGDRNTTYFQQAIITALDEHITKSVPKMAIHK